MPYALKLAGFYGGIFLIVCVAYCSDYTLRLLITLANKTKSKYYEDLMTTQFGHRGYLFVVGAMGIFAYGAMVAYLMGIGEWHRVSSRTVHPHPLQKSHPIAFLLTPFSLSLSLARAGDNMAIVVATVSGINLGKNMWIKRVTLISIALGAVLPLALLKDMSKLSKTSFVSLFSVIVILCVVFTRFVTGPCPGLAPGEVCDVPLPGVYPSPASDLTLYVVGKKFLPAVGVIAFAFICHHACFIVYNTLRDNTEARWAKTVHLTLITATTVMVALSFFAFLTFRGVMSGSFLTNYSYKDSLSNGMRCLFALCQTLTYPIELFVARHAIHAIAFPAQKWTEEQHYTITCLLWGSTVAIALNVADLGAVLELTGGIAAVSIGFILPPLLHFKMTPEVPWKFWAARGLHRKLTSLKTFAISYAVLFLGILAMSFTILTMISELTADEEHNNLGIKDAFDETVERDQFGNVIQRGGGATQAGGTSMFDINVVGGMRMLRDILRTFRRSRR